MIGRWLGLRVLWTWGICLSVVTLVAAGVTVLGGPVASAEPAACALPEGDAAPQRVAPGSVNIDQAALDEAIAFAASRMRSNIQVYRNNCLIGTGPLNDVSGNVASNLWSSTKSVLAMVAGVAYTEGLLDLEAPIGRYLPEGQGDAAHRAITVRQLLTQTSGLKQSILAEAYTALVPDLNIVEQALTLPFEHEPGTNFAYAQRPPDLFAYVVERAVGQDLQQFAQQKQFSPLGIDAEDYFWQRDRAGHTYGFAFLMIPPNDLARLGLLLLNNGEWNGNRIIAADYMDQLHQPSPRNACYGFLVWLNQAPCIGVTVPSEQVFEQPPFLPMPPDTYATVGFLQQTNFVMPSLHMLVTWTGFFGDVSPDPATVFSASLNSELYREFLRKLARAVTDVELPDPGPYVPTVNTTIDQPGMFDPNVLLGAVGVGPLAPPGCTPEQCGPTPLVPPFSNTPDACRLGVCIPLPGIPQRHGQ
jgi:CubicO group peptidase (beta-lactamase class C family)